MVVITRSAFLKATAATALTGLLTACTTGSNDTSSSSTSSAASGESYTVKHAFGETTFSAVPQKIAVVNFWKNPDVLLALGVVPAGTPVVTYGANANGSTDWFDAKLAELGGTAPVTYDETDGPDYEALATLAPDAIFSVYGDMTQEVYDKLTAIAPVVAMPESVGAYAASWEDVVNQAAAMLQKDDEGAALIEATNKTIDEAAAKYSNLAGKTFVAGMFDLEAQTLSAYVASDSRSQFLTSLGMNIAPYIEQNATEADAFFMTISGEVLPEVQSDLVWAWGTSDSDEEAIKSNTLFSQMPAVANGGLVVETDAAISLALSAASPLSLDWAINQTETLAKLSAAIDASQAS
ncbi:ABC transporter substrate-binding protein [Rothia nasimurium]|uniref:ABC transporter substrate-binding protein n=1 Tax=Rothia nasimurium TaxID=85336 RepID=A0A4Y9F658_9MICC|nr:ABC transporter substrate-binding protein [Rothia nasimurium]MBF0807306.1 ABC transporter substrate-binding protein [Rothia nasimurium]TFU24048.1 ABC transporter substrate-binding protein [Rothia nasimurium]